MIRHVDSGKTEYLFDTSNYLAFTIEIFVAFSAGSNAPTNPITNATAIPLITKLESIANENTTWLKAPEGFMVETV